MERDTADAHVHMRRDNLFPCSQLYAFWMTPYFPKLGTYLMFTHRVRGPYCGSFTVGASVHNHRKERLWVEAEADLGLLNGFQPLTIITKHSILGIAAALDPLLGCVAWSSLHMLQIVLIVRK